MSDARDIKRKMWPKLSLIALFVLLISGTQPAFGSLTIGKGKRPLGEAYTQLPLSFELNRGQTDGRVKYLARGQGYSLFLTSREAVTAEMPVSHRSFNMASSRRVVTRPPCIIPV